jgi:predicted DsbA family dithiol-disulfide isomerase
MTIVPIRYFSDLLCVWAYVAELRVDAVKAAFGDRVRFEPVFCSVFGDSPRKIGVGWAAKGGYEGFNGHLREVAARFPEIDIHPDLWLTVRPASSTSPHLFAKAVRMVEAEDACVAGTADLVTSGLRAAFFQAGRDIATRAVQNAVAEDLGVDRAAVQTRIDDGSAFAALAGDYQDAEAMGIQGSPSFVLNEGRQKLYGNVGFRVLEANIQELLRTPTTDQASWC